MNTMLYEKSKKEKSRVEFEARRSLHYDGTSKRVEGSWHP